MNQSWQVTILYLIPFISAVIALLNAFFAWQKRSLSGSKNLMALMAAVAIWSLCEGIQNLAVSLPTKIFWSQIQYIGIVSTPLLYLIFAARYSRQNSWLTKWNIILLSIIPIATLIIVATNDLHMWHWRDYSWIPEINIVRYHYGPWFWVFTTTSYIYLISATWLLIKSSFQLQDLFRWQVRTVILAAAVPWLANLLYLTGSLPLPGIDPTPLAFTISGFLLTLSIREFQLIDLTPIARNKLVDTFQDSLIVVNKAGLVADINPAALAIIDKTLDECLGKPADAVLNQWPELAERFRNPGAEITQTSFVSDQNQHFYDTRISPLFDERGDLLGHLYLLRDVTERRKIETERAKLAAVIDQAKETIVITNLEGKILYANPHFEEITGYKAEEVLGKNSSVLQSGKHGKEFYQELWSTISNGDIWSGTFINKRKDGEEYHEAATIFPIKDTAGRIINYAAVKRDISAEVQAERAIKYYSDQLTKLHEISIELSQENGLDDVYHKAILLGHQRLGFERISFWSVDPEDPDYFIGTFSINEVGIIKDQRNNRLHKTDTPISFQNIKSSDRNIIIREADLCDEHGMIIGKGDLSITGIWDREKMVGYVSIDNLITRKPITERQVAVQILFSQILGNLIIRKRADEAIQTFSKNLTALHDISVELSQKTTFNELNKHAVIAGVERLGFERLGVWYLEAEKTKLRGSFGIDEYGKLRNEQNRTIPINSSPIHETLLSGSTRVIHKVDIPLFNDKSDPVGKGDVAASGLWDEKSIIGYIAADNLMTKKQFKPQQLEILLLYAQIIGTLGNRIRTAEEIQRNAREQRLLNDITQTTIQQTDYKVMLQILADRMGEIFHADGCYITLWDEDTQKATPGAAYGPFKRQFITDKTLLSEINQLAKIILETEKVSIIEDTFSSKSINQTMTHRLSIRAVMVLPLIANNVRLGTATISFKQPHKFKSDQIDLGEKAAQQIALAILKNRLLEEAQTRATEAMTLQQAGAAVVSTLHRDEALERILEELNRVVPYDSASVQLLKGNEMEIVGGRGFIDIEAVLGLCFSLDDNSPNSVVFEKGEPVIIVDAPQKYEAFKSPPHDHVHGWMGVPLKAHEEIMGMLALDSCESGKFTNDHSRLAAAFADQVAIALENSRLFEETQWLAIHDSLTGLYNRRHFMLLAEKEFERAKRYGTPLSAIMLDIDHFKQVNDSKGHLTGDQVLQQIAKICNNNLRSHDLIGRYGGEEFIILLPETSATSVKMDPSKGTKKSEPAKTVAERLRKEVEMLKLDGIQGDFQISISLGIAETSPQIEIVEQLIDHADQGLLVAKHSGRNRVVHWSPDEAYHERQPE